MDNLKEKRNAGSLIGIGLDQLHKESREWIETVEFWKDEIHFFDTILQKKVAHKEPDFKGLLENMGKVHEHLFTYLIDEIYAHERLLSRLQKGEKGLADMDYRNKHSELKGKMDLFTKDFMEFKRMVFGYAKKF